MRKVFSLRRPRRQWLRRRGLGRAVGVAGLGVAICALLAAAAGAGSADAATRSAADATTGFVGGTDSNYIAIPGPAPYKMPAIGGSYGGYIGMVGNWANWRGCHGAVVYSKSDSNAARTNLATYHTGIGVGTYWFMGGPGVDPHFNGRDAEAADWGADQAKAALADLNKLSPHANYPVLFMDVELPGNAPAYTPAPDNGWNAVYTSSCSGKVKTHGINPQVDRAEFNGFASYLTEHSSYKAGVYSAPSIWNSIFGKYGGLSNTYEWTYNGDTSSLSHLPDGWCLAGTRTCAQFFGGMTDTSKYALMWQWSGGGGTYNGYGDFDQIDTGRTP
jgi:hypothetical protein